MKQFVKWTDVMCPIRSTGADTCDGLTMNYKLTLLTTEWEMQVIWDKK